MTGDEREEELLRAADVLAQRWARGGEPGVAPPEGVILCHQVAPLGSAVSRWRARAVRGFHADLRLLRRSGGRIGVATGFGVGAPAASALVEELAAFGVRRFVSLGVGGGLVDGQQPGDLVVAERALRDEGTSRHYLPPAAMVEGSASLTGRLARAFEHAGLSCTRGVTCTTDTPYRTTPADVARWRAAGGMVVEMEIAALFAVGECRGLEVSAACCVADRLTARGWSLAFDAGAVDQGLRAAFDAAVRALE